LRHVGLAEVNDRHAVAVDQKLLEVPANVVRLQVVVRQTTFLGEVQSRRWTVGLQARDTVGTWLNIARQRPTVVVNFPRDAFLHLYTIVSKVKSYESHDDDE